MKKISSLLLTLSSIFLSSQAIAEAKPNITYYIAQRDNRPFQNIEPSAAKKGIITDIADAIFGKSDYNYETKVIPILRLRSELENIEKNKPTELKRFVVYSAPIWDGKNPPYIYSSKPLFAMKTTLTCRHDNKFHYSKISDLYGKTVLLIQGFDYPEIEPMIKEKKINALRVKETKQALTILADKSRTEMCFVELEPRINIQIVDFGFKISDFTSFDFSDTIKPIAIHLAMSKDLNQKDITFINNKIDSLLSDGTIDKILKNY